MPRTPTLENPFAPEKHRSADDPKFVGKILGPKAEAAMRGVLGQRVVQEPEPEGNLNFTDAEGTKSAEALKSRDAIEKARKELIAWAEEIGKDEEWALSTFHIHTDGTLTVDGDLTLRSLLIKRLPEKLVNVSGSLDLTFTRIESLDGFPKKIGDNLNLSNTPLSSLKGFPQEVGGYINLSATRITSLDGLPQKVFGNLNLFDTPITSLDGLPTPENIDGEIIFSKNRQYQRCEEAEARGYSVQKCGDVTGHGYDNEYDDAHSA